MSGAGGEPPVTPGLGAGIPVFRTSFVGRSVERAELADVVTRHRIVTVTGAGGTGKTRLAAQVATDVAPTWPGGVWWVDLTGVTSGVADVVAGAVGAPTERAVGPIGSIAATLEDRPTLVCFDNCEHVVDEVAAVVEELAARCPRLHVVATSREVLRVRGETVWAAPTMSPADARTLFADRGSTASPRAALGDDAVVRRLCSRLDGMPLAIELAAAWLRSLTVQQIEAGLDDRFALLVRGPRGVLARHQTLLASMEWSHGLLGSDERLVFRRLGVFAAGFTEQVAVRVAAGSELSGDAVRGALRSLVDKSMVQVVDGGLAVRYRLLDTVREFAVRLLVDAAEVEQCRDRHLDAYLGLVEAAAPLLDVDKDAWRERVFADYDNLRVALDRGLAAHDLDRGRRLAAGLTWGWHMSSHGSEGMRYLCRAISGAPEDRSGLQVRLLTGLALVADTTNPIGIEYDIAQRSLAIADELQDDGLRALPTLLAAVGQLYADLDRSRALSIDAARLAVGVEDGFVRDGALALQGTIAQLRDDHGDARRLLSAAIEPLLKRGDRGVASTALATMATDLASTGELHRGLAVAGRAVDVAEPLVDHHRIGNARATLAMIQAQMGNLDAARATLGRVLRVRGEVREPAFTPGLGRVLAAVDLRRDDPEGALRWLEPELAREEYLGTYLALQSVPLLVRALRYLGRHGEAVEWLRRTSAMSEDLDLPRVRADRLEESGWLALDSDVPVAADRLHDALALRWERRLVLGCLDNLDALAHLYARTDRAADAARTYAAVEANRAAMTYVRDPAQQRLRDADLERLTGRVAAGDLAEYAREGAALTVADAAGYVRRGRGPRQRPAHGWASLTPTEESVARLASSGLSNPEIGSSMFMSRSTVKTHLSHVYAKLGVTNRTELAARVVGDSAPVDSRAR
jgi:predicted ATPase/DNA-binding CsgD family transcriptional regulator